MERIYLAALALAIAFDIYADFKVAGLYPALFASGGAILVTGLSLLAEQEYRELADDINRRLVIDGLFYDEEE